MVSGVAGGWEPNGTWFRDLKVSFPLPLSGRGAGGEGASPMALQPRAC
jgi:hypothetical protein